MEYINDCIKFDIIDSNMICIEKLIINIDNYLIIRCITNVIRSKYKKLIPKFDSIKPIAIPYRIKILNEKLEDVLTNIIETKYIINHGANNLIHGFVKSYHTRNKELVNCFMKWGDILIQNYFPKTISINMLKYMMTKKIIRLDNVMEAASFNNFNNLIKRIIKNNRYDWQNVKNDMLSQMLTNAAARDNKNIIDFIINFYYHDIFDGEVEGYQNDEIDEYLDALGIDLL